MIHCKIDHIILHSNKYYTRAREHLTLLMQQ